MGNNRVSSFECPRREHWDNDKSSRADNVFHWDAQWQPIWLQEFQLWLVSLCRFHPGLHIPLLHQACHHGLAPGRLCHGSMDMVDHHAPDPGRDPLSIAKLEWNTSLSTVEFDGEDSECVIHDSSLSRWPTCHDNPNNDIGQSSRCIQHILSHPEWTPDWEFPGVGHCSEATIHEYNRD